LALVLAEKHSRAATGSPRAAG